MKKRLLVFCAVIGVLFLASCSSGAKEETKTFTMNQNGVDMELVYTYEGDKVKTQTANNIMPYSAMGVTNKEEAQIVFDSIADQYSQVKGLDYSINYMSSEATESFVVNYDELDYDSAKQLPGVSFEGNIENGISMKRTEKMLLDQGWELKE